MRKRDKAIPPVLDKNTSRNASLWDRLSLPSCQDDYWEQSVQPLNCLIFISPLLLLYEIGVVWLGPAAMRNGADLWLREFSSRLGVGEYVFLPVTTCILLFGMHHVSRRKWELRSDVLSGMVCESFAIGILIIAMAHVYCDLAGTGAKSIEAAMIVKQASPVAVMLSYLGAGIYEELLFRFLLLSATLQTLRRVGIQRSASLAFAVLSTSTLFAAAHYELFFSVGLEFTWYTFLFRLMAGSVFSMLYLYRGIGIVVGAHAVYDILVATFAS